MPDITIRSIPQELIDKINSLVSLSKSTDRSAFLVNALQDYCLFHDRYYLHCLPDTIHILAADEVNKEAKRMGDLLKYALGTVNAGNKLMAQLSSVLSEEDIEISEQDDL